MHYRNILLAGLFSSALASPLEVRANAPVDTTKVLQHLSGGKPLPWQVRNGGKLRVLTVPKAQLEAAEAAVGGGHHRRDLTSDAAFTSLAPRQGQSISGLHAKCFNSGSWALDTAMVPLITSICDEGAFNWFLDSGSAQVLHFLGLTNEKNDQMSVFVTLKNLVDGVFTGVDSNMCTTMAEALILHDCQGKNADTRGGIIYGKNLEGKDAVSLAIDPTTDKCNC